MGLFGINVALSSELKNFIDSADLNLHAKISHIDINGKSAKGRGYHFELLPALEIKSSTGFSLNVSSLFISGSKSPKGETTSSVLKGARGFNVRDRNYDFYGISDFYATYNFPKTKTFLELGVMRLNTALNDRSIMPSNRAIGGVLRNELSDKLDLKFYAFDTWVTNDLSTQFGQNSEVGNDFYGIELNGNLYSYMRVDFILSHIRNLVDIGFLGSLSYDITLPKTTFSLNGQLAFIKLANESFFITKNANLKKYFEDSNIAHNRGVLNLWSQFKFDEYSFIAGFLQSFAQGYGAVLQTNALKIPGIFWHNIINADIAGFGLTSSGSGSKTDINIAYTSQKYEFESLAFTFDALLISGKNAFPIPSKLSISPRKNLTKDFVANLKVVEVSPQISYKINDNFNAQLQFALLFGDLQSNKAQVSLTYDF